MYDSTASIALVVSNGKRLQEHVYETRKALPKNRERKRTMRFQRSSIQSEMRFRENSLALRFASNILRADQEIVLSAIEQSQ